MVVVIIWLKTRSQTLCISEPLLFLLKAQGIHSLVLSGFPPCYCGSFKYIFCNGKQDGGPSALSFGDGHEHSSMWSMDNIITKLIVEGTGWFLLESVLSLQVCHFLRAQLGISFIRTLSWSLGVVLSISPLCFYVLALTTFYWN